MANELKAQNKIQLFENSKIRSVWDSEKEKWYFSVVDVVAVLTDSIDFQTARKYWNKLKQRLKEEGNETVTNCHQLAIYFFGKYAIHFWFSLSIASIAFFTRIALFASSGALLICE